MSRIDEFDLMELAAAILDVEDQGDDAVFDGLREEFGIDLDQFGSLVGRLIDMIDVGQSPLTGKRYKGFGVCGMFYAKVEIPAAAQKKEES